MSCSQGSLQLASASEIAVACALLHSQGYHTSVHTSTCATFQYILSSYEVCRSQPAPAGGLAANDHRSAGSNDTVLTTITEVVVPVSATNSQLSMALMLRLMDGVPRLLPTNAATAASADSAAPTEDLQQTVKLGTPTDSSPSGAAAAVGSAKHNISLAMVSGAHVVQVQLFDGIQPPSESYG